MIFNCYCDDEYFKNNCSQECDLCIYGKEMKPVVLAKDYGAQWYTYHGIKALLEDPNILNYISSTSLEEDLEWVYELENYFDLMYGERETWGDITSLKIELVPKECNFTVELVDGWETIILT
jgi:hypothetical protein